MKIKQSHSRILTVSLVALCLILIINYYNKITEKKGVCSFVSAEFIIVNQVKQKKIIIFATEPKTELEPLNLKNDISITVIFSRYILENNQPLTGGYNQFNNVLLLEYASYEYLNKNKEIGKAVIYLIAKFAPKTSVATQGKSISAKKLKSMIESNELEALKILNSRATQWTFRKKNVKDLSTLNF